MGCQPSAIAECEVLPEAPAHAIPLRKTSDAPEVTEPLGTFHVVLEGRPGDKLGATLADCDGRIHGAAIASVSEGGLLHEWNLRNSEHAVGTGDVIVKVNGAEGYWNILKQIRKMGTLNVVVQKAALKDEWSEQTSCLTRKLATYSRQGSGSLLYHASCDSGAEACSAQLQADIMMLPVQKSGSGCTSEQCCICLDAFEPDENLVQLSCKHDFHVECMYKWLRHNSQGKCPLCTRPVFGPDDSN